MKLCDTRNISSIYVLIQVDVEMARCLVLGGRFRNLNIFLH